MFTFFDQFQWRYSETTTIEKENIVYFGFAWDLYIEILLLGIKLPYLKCYADFT